jgi:hypothetical protein
MKEGQRGVKALWVIWTFTKKKYVYCKRLSCVVVELVLVPFSRAFIAGPSVLRVPVRGKHVGRRINIENTFRCDARKNTTRKTGKLFGCSNRNILP